MPCQYLPLLLHAKPQPAAEKPHASTLRRRRPVARHGRPRKTASCVTHSVGGVDAGSNFEGRPVCGRDQELERSGLE